MKKRTLADTNPSLKEKRAVMRRVRSLASSTAIETGEPIDVLEKKVIHLRSSKHRITLA
ncbi:MAG: hypothetical protein RPU42_03030 [Candidatus Sedimenticola sp. (ex Thyasira tokunagai)]